MNSTLLNNRYRFIKALGDGGFGETFLAEDTQMPSGRQCVVKKLKPIANNPQIYQLVQERFQREAAILETLGDDQAQIPRLYAYFSESSHFYLVEEWIQGETLSKKLESTGIFNETTVRHFLIKILPVFEFIHSQQIVHRDIKPDNIILRDLDRLPVLIDFGAVKEAMGTEVTTSGNPTSSIVIGTPGFMPSEQAAGRPVYSSDLYSLGLTAIYLLTGKVPQELETDSRTGQIIWRSHAPQISPTLAGVLDKSIEYHPRDRYPTAREMLEALQQPASPVNRGNSTIVSAAPAQQPTLVSRYDSPSGAMSSQSMQAATTLSTRSEGLKNMIIGSSIVGLFIVMGILLAKSQQPPTVIVQQPESPPATPERVQHREVTDSSNPTPTATPIPPTTHQTSTSEPDVAPQPTPPRTFINPKPAAAPASPPKSERIITPVTPNSPVAVKSVEQQLNDLADKLFYERHPELNGRKLNSGETSLSQEWLYIRHCDAIVDFRFQQRHPELKGRKIMKSETHLAQEWWKIRDRISSCY